MRRGRKRLFVGAIALFAVAIVATALVDRQIAAVALYVVGGLLLVVAVAGGMGGGPRVGMPGAEREHVQVFRHDMQQRLRWQSENLLLIGAGAVLVGLGVLLDLS